MFQPCAILRGRYASQHKRYLCKMELWRAVELFRSRVCLAREKRHACTRLLEYRGKEPLANIERTLGTGTNRNGTACPLDVKRGFCKLHFSCMWTAPIIAEETQREFEYPQREAAFFYGLFLRGHSAEELRRDIEVPPQVLARWHREAEREPSLRDVLERMVEYRRHVLAIFETLIGYDIRSTRVQ
jgi:hypothetical protein